MTTPSPIPDAELDRFADAVMSIAHRIEPRGLDLPGRRRLTPREILVMHEVAVTPGVTATQIARGLDLQRSNVSATLHTLERESLLVRVAAADGRGAGFALTDEARRELALVRAHRSERLRSASDDLLREVVSISAALSRLAGGIGADRRAE
nr:MarR family transcriptional regulator [Microbacterium hydrocarbonoxydans]